MVVSRVNRGMCYVLQNYKSMNQDIKYIHYSVDPGWGSNGSGPFLPLE